MKNSKMSLANSMPAFLRNNVYAIRRKIIFSTILFCLCIGISGLIVTQQITASVVQKAEPSPMAFFNPAANGNLSNAINFAIEECTYALTPTSAIFGSTGGSGFFHVTTGAGCVYTAESDDANIIITSGTGIGSGAVFFTVFGSNVPRTGTINVNGQTFTVIQTPGCDPAITSSVTNFSYLGGNGSISFNLGAGCSYTATAPDSFITITNGTGTGSGTINFTVAPNSGDDRSGNIFINGIGYTISQSGGCSTFITPTSANFLPDGGNANITVTIADGCPYTATTSDSFITITNGTGAGSGTINFTVAPNLGDNRTGRITVNNRTFSISQTGSCPTTLTPSSMLFSPGGGTASFNVTTLPECAYMATTTAPHITIINGTGTGSGTVTFSINANPGTSARRSTITVNNRNFSIQQTAFAVARKPFFDFDGDGKADLSVFRPETAVWYALNSQSGFAGTQFGLLTDTIVPGDYDRDGKTDYAVYRGGNWYMQTGTSGFLAHSFGLPNDIPVSADFDGDGRSEIAVYRPANGTWYIYNLFTRRFTSLQFGTGEDKPVAGDYDGDLIADVAVFRPSSGTWYIQGSTGGFTSVQFGNANDKPVAADYDGDKKTDVAVFRPSNGTWYLLRSTDGFAGIQFGSAPDLPVPADYDGDGKTDLAVFRNGTWYQQRSTAGFAAINFGTAADKPVPNAFVR